MKGLGLIVLVALSATPACASLQGLSQLMQPPRFEEASDHQSEIRLLPPGPDLPVGGAGVRVWTRVTNPNPFGFTLSTLRVTLFVEDARAASGDFPLGLPLQAGQEAVVPLDLAISFGDLPGLADVVRRAISGRTLPYKVEGTVGVEAGRFGQPTFGPMTLFTGELRVRGSGLGAGRSS
jgi:hypothetical protein